MTGGITYYHFLEEITKNFESRKQEVIGKLKEICRKIFTKDNLLISYTAGKDGFYNLEEAMKKLTDKLYEGGGQIYPFSWIKGNKNEGFKTSSQVNYVARCGNFKEKGFQYTGALRILKVMLSYDYLWLNIRVKGGAYGRCV